ncbi:MAG: hypothetical protein ACR5LD_07765 [Symbiopectobacterium sp.]
MRYFQLPCSGQQMISVTDWLPELDEQAVVAWFREKTTCTAILCANNSLALRGH